MNADEIKTIEDLRSYLWEILGYVDMDTVDDVLDIVKKHKRLLKEHPEARDKTSDASAVRTEK